MDIIKVEKRDETVSAKQLRRSGKIPCSVYGGALKNAISIQMEGKDAQQLCSTKREGSTLRLELGEEKIPVQIKEKVVHLVNNGVEHISFQALKADQKVNSVAQIFLKNAEVVDGVVEQELYDVPYTSLPKDMIDVVTIDLEGQPAGTAVTVGEIEAFRDEAITLRIEPDTMAYQIKEKRIAEEE